MQNRNLIPNIILTARYRIIGLIIALVLLGSLIFNLSTPFGIGLRHDSLGYIEVAENLVAGNGLVFNDGTPLRQWAPMYPILLSLAARLTGSEVVPAAWWLHLLLFLLSGLVLARLVARYVTAEYKWLIFGLVFLAFIFTADMLEMYTLVLSEAAFITATIIGSLFALRYTERNQIIDLLGMALFFTLAATTRFIGLYLVLPGLFVIWILAQKDWRQKIGSSAVFVAIFFAPVVWWVLRGRQLNTAAGDGESLLTYSQSSIPLPNLKHLLQGFMHMSAWFLPEAIPVVPRAALFGLIGLVLLFALVRQWRRHSLRTFLSRQQFQLGSFIIVLMVSYLAALTASMFTIAVGITPTERYLSPLVPFAIGLLTLILVLILDETFLNRFGRYIKPAGVVLLLAYFAFGAMTVGAYHQEGVGHLTRTIESSELVALARQLPADSVLYSNEAARLQVILDRYVEAMPLLEKYFQKLPPDVYEREFEAMTADMAQNNGYLILMLDISAYERQVIGLDNVLARPELIIVSQVEDEDVNGYILVVGDN